MSKFIVLFNSKANNGQGENTAKNIHIDCKEKDLEYVDVLQVNDYTKFFNEKGLDQNYVLVGGDGTLNYLLNSVEEKDLPHKLFYYPAGTGNDFWSDIQGNVENGPSDISNLVKKLPTCKVNGMTKKFINGVGYGIDGYCCEVGDQLRAKSDKPINYAGIAIKGLLFHYKPTNAKVTVDGKVYEFKKVWLAPVMKGRYYGGGMIPTPDQDRNDPEHKLSCLVWHGSGKLKTLINFPGIFKGAHIKKSHMCTVLTGDNITVEFDRAVAAQVDGETVLNVTKIECSK